MGIIEASIPLFFALIGIELLVARLRGRPLFRLNDSISDLSCGILSQMSGIFTKLIELGIYVVIVERWSVQHWLPGVPAWPGGAPLVVGPGRSSLALSLPDLLGWTVAFVLVDFAYYWSHRLSHEVHILWAGHVVHHSSEEYNLSVALRQSALTPWTDSTNVFPHQPMPTMAARIIWPSGAARTRGPRPGSSPPGGRVLS